MSSLQQLLIKLSENPDTKGKHFEHACKWFLENDSRYTALLKKVWIWQDWPGNWGRDKGIDLIAETHQGDIWAIQAKAYDESIYITKEDVDKFLSESSRKIISHRLLIATTDRIGPNANEVIEAQEKQVSKCLRDKLESSSLDWMLSLTNHAPIKSNPKIPRPHQDIAISSVLQGFETSSQGQLYMACGTGKTLVGLWIAKKLNSQNTLVLVPSISLVAQLYREWSENRGEFSFDPIFVCSDETVSKNDEQEYMNSSELGFPVTTAADAIIQQYSSSSRPKVIFSTYHSSPIIAQACSLNTSLQFDLVIADEAHRCAGKANSAFATITHKDAIKAQRKLYMTATPKIFSDQAKQKTQECAYEIVSMDDEEKFGPVFHKLLFSDAIKQDLLSDYQVIISVMDDATYRDFAERGRFVAFDNHETDARTLASQLLIAKAIKKFDLKKVISFHSRTKSATAFIQTFSKSLSLLPDTEEPVIAYQATIFGEMPQSERHKILKQFDATSEGAALIANVKCLSEGVDVPALDGVVFVDPKGSEIDIVQAVGRAIRKSPNKKLGTIIIPIFVDGASNETQDLEKSCFKKVWDVVRALRAHDDMLAEELDSIRLELGKRTYKAPPKLSKVTIDIPINIDATFGEALQVRVIKSCSQAYNWCSFEEAREFVKQLKLISETQWRTYINGECTDLPSLPTNIPRAPWVAYENKWISWGDFLGTNIIAPRLRKYRPYEEACAFVHNLKLKGKDDWTTYSKGEIPSLPSLPNDIPASPAKTYKRKDYGEKWVGWGDFLGTGKISNQNKAKSYRTYAEAKLFANSLKLRTAKEWYLYISGHFKDLSPMPKNIPKKPDSVYDEWENWQTFLGNTEISKFNCNRSFLPFNEARAYVHALGLQKQKDWTNYCAGTLANLPKKPSDIPSNPQKKYKLFGWLGYADWLGHPD